jgi:pyruvate kinase
MFAIREQTGLHYPVTVAHHEFLLTKIITTLGPASSGIDSIEGMIDLGANVCRINFSHGDFDSFRALLRNVRAAADRKGRPIGVIGDLSGPKFRVGDVGGEGLVLETGDEVILTAGTSDLTACESDRGVRSKVPVRDRMIIEELSNGQRILLDDGSIVLSCIRAAGDREAMEVPCRVEVGGRLLSGKGINLPETDLSLPSLTEWDLRCVEFAVEEGFDFLALSFVRKGEDIRVLKDRLRALGARPSAPKSSGGGSGPQFSAYGGGSKSFIPVIAKIEKPQALDNLESIVDESDVVMVARGDLGVEMDLAKVPAIQRHIVDVCHNFGKPVVVATQMLQSMIESPNPTRAEVSDVANAIFEGAHAVMLSGESAVGRFPLEAVKIMRRIARQTNDYLRSESDMFALPKKIRHSRYRTAALSQGVSVIVRDLEAKLIVMWSQLGGGASYLSQIRSLVPIVAFSSDTEALRRMSILYGIVPVFMDQPRSTPDFLRRLDSMVLERKWVAPGTPIVLVLGEPIGCAGLTNQIQIHYAGESLGEIDPAGSDGE